MKKNMAATANLCLLCGDSASGDDRSSEHIIPAALGGRRTVSGFICRKCNSDAGRTCDAALAESLEGWTRLLDISRQDPLPRARVVHTSDGTPVRMLPGNRVELGHPILPEEFTEGEHVVARSIGELRQIVQKINNRRNLGLDVAAILENATTRSTYLDEPIELTGGCWGPEHYKSLVKSALAQVFHAGHDPACAEIALAYLTGDTEKRCFFPYYNRDLISQRESGIPINCVHVKGDPNTHELMAYVEIYGILRSVIRLSEQYEGEHFEHQYAFDLTDGHELDLVVELSSAILTEAERETDYYGSETGALKTAIEAVLRRALGIANMKELTRISVSAVDEYFAALGKGPDEPVTEDEYQSMWSHLEESVMPFLEHLHQPMNLPDHVLEQLSQDS